MLRCLGDLEYAQGKYSEVQVLYCEAFVIAPQYDVALIAAGRAAFDLADLPSAEKAFRKAAEVQGPYNGTALFELGRCYGRAAPSSKRGWYSKTPST